MEALDFVKLHNLYAHFSSMVENSYPLLGSDCYEDEQEDDSFFDLEFFSSPSSETRTSTEKNPCFAQQGLILPQPDLISKRKILPIELTSKPESPVSVSVSLLKSAPRLSISLFKKPKLMAKQKMEETDSSSLKLQNTESKRFAFKLNRVNSSRNNNHRDPSERQSKRFSREGMQKYLKLIKPLYIKVSKRNNFRASPESSPTMASAQSSMDEKQRNIAIGIRVVCRRLGKSKSSSSATGMAVSPTNRRDDSLLQQHDGIQSAILHCKRSFTASRDASLLNDGVDGTSDGNPFGSGELQKQKAGKDVPPEAQE